MRSPSTASVAAAALLLALAATVPRAAAFAKGDVIKVLASHVGPVNNPSEVRVVSAAAARRVIGAASFAAPGAEREPAPDRRGGAAPERGVMSRRRRSLDAAAQAENARPRLRCFARRAPPPLLRLTSRTQPLALPVPSPSLPQTYNYFVLPLCAPKGGAGAGAAVQDMSESLTGDHKVETAYELRFGEDVEFQETCTRDFSREDLSKLSTAIEEDWCE